MPNDSDVEDVVRLIKENAKRENRDLDVFDVYLIGMVRMVGVETTNRFISEYRP